MMKDTQSKNIITLIINAVMFGFATYEAIHWFGVSNVRFGVLLASAAIFATFSVLTLKKLIDPGKPEAEPDAEN